MNNSNIRQRKLGLTATPVKDNEEVKKKSKKSYSDGMIATFLFLMSLPVRFHNMTLPAHVV